MKELILIVGCGFLGSYLAKHAEAQTEETIVATVRDIKSIRPLKGVEYIECDITKSEDVAKLKKRLGKEPLTVFWFAACHNIDYICDNKDDAYNVNVTALDSFLSTFTDIKKFFFSSTDCVYGENSLYGGKLREGAPLNPVNEYGRQKILAEKVVLAKGFTVLRYPFMLGESLTDKKHFYDNICHRLKSGIKTEMIDGMHRCVLSYRQAAELTFSLSLLSEIPQVINVCSDSVLSKYDIGTALAKKLSVSQELIVKITEQEGQKFFKDRRASCTSMDNSLLKQLTGLEKITWEEEEC